MTVPGQPLIDQELAVHLFAPCDGPRAADAQEQLRTIWSRCRALLGTTRVIPGTLLPTELPPVPPTDETAERALAAMEDDTGDFQVVARTINDIVNLSIVFAAPTDTSERRRRTGSAAPPTWTEFTRWWDELSAHSVDALLGETRLYLAKQVTNVAPELLAESLHAALPHSDDRYRAEPQHYPPNFVVWEATTSPVTATRRDVVVVAPLEQDEELSAWTWSHGDAYIPPLARYLMHAAKVRYQLRVWERDQASVTTPRRRIDDQVRAFPGNLDQPILFDRLAVNEAQGTITAAMIREMRLTVAIGGSNMAAALPIPLLQDRGLADSLSQQLDDAITYLDLAVQRARQIREIARRPEPQQADPLDPIAPR